MTWARMAGADTSDANQRHSGRQAAPPARRTRDDARRRHCKLGLHSVVVDGNKRSVAGPRRLAAVRWLGWTKAPSRIVRTDETSFYRICICCAPERNNRRCPMLQFPRRTEKLSNVVD